MKEEQVEENAEGSGFERQVLALERDLPELLTIAAELYEALRHTKSVCRRLAERRTEVFQAFDSLPAEDHPLAFGMFFTDIVGGSFSQESSIDDFPDDSDGHGDEETFINIVLRLRRLGACH